MKGIQKKSGFTFVEALIVMSIIGVVFIFLESGVKLLNYLSYQRNLIAAQSSAQLALYTINRDVQNSIAITDIKSGQNGIHLLELKMIDFSNRNGTLTNPYDIRENDFSALSTINNKGIITYKVINGGPGPVYLEREANYPFKGIQYQKFLVNLIDPGAGAVFSPGQFGGSKPPYLGVNIRLNLKIPQGKKYEHKDYSLTILHGVNNDETL